MQVVVEFYRTRDADDAHALVGRETAEVDDLDGAIAAAWLLAQTLDMPQRPDAMAISDASGTILHSGVFGEDMLDQGNRSS